jgi:rhodanese-related sulfurtransferase
MAHHQHSPGFLALVQDAKRRVREIPISEYRGLAANGHPLVLVDVREDHEWEGGRISGARHLGKGIIERDIEREIPDKAAPLVLYCGGGYRSALVADSLQRMGYTDVRSLAGGMRGWIAQGLPVET